MAKKQILYSILLFMVVFIVLPAFSESIFLRDGSIVEGVIQKETDRETRVLKKTGEIVIIPRKNIIRTLVSEDYKTKMYIMKTDGNEIAAYIVEEDNERYICRHELNSPEEFTIPKREVLSASKVPFDVLSKQKQIKEEEEKMRKAAEQQKKLESREGGGSIIWSADVCLLGPYGRSTELNDLFTDEILFGNLSLFSQIVFTKNRKGWGFDWVICRWEYINWKTPYDSETGSEALTVSDPRTPQFEQLFNYHITADYQATIEANVFFTGINVSFQEFELGIGSRSSRSSSGCTSWEEELFIRLYFGFLVGYASSTATLIHNYGSDNPNEIAIKTKSYKAYQIHAGVEAGSIPLISVEVRYAYVPITFADGSRYNMGGLAFLVGAGIRLAWWI